MKKKTRELERMRKAELESRLAELKKELMKHNAQIATGTIPKSPGLIKQTKKEIARITMFIETKNRKVLDKTKEVGKQE